MANTRSEVEYIHIETWTILSYQKAKKLSKINRIMSKWLRSELEDISTDLTWNNLSSSKKNSCNELEHIKYG